MTIRNYILLAALLLLAACEEKMTEEEISSIGISSCRKPAPFIKQLGFDELNSAFSTSVKGKTGLMLIQPPKIPSDTFRTYQDPSWSQYGDFGSIATDDQGNAYVYSIPFINTLNISLSTLHTIYKVDAQSGKMAPFMQLPKIDSIAGINSFGMLGIYFDCHAKLLYVSTVGGSTAEKEKGKIYALDPSTKTIKDEYESGDAMGICVGGVSGQKRLYFGKARNSEVHSIELRKDGSFKSNTLKTELSIDDIGPRGDDKVRKIRFDKNGYMNVYGVEFNYNLSGQLDKPETFYQFRFDRLDEKWVFVKAE